MNCQEEFFEVNVSVIVLVEVSEDVVTKLFCVCRHEAGAVYVHEGLKNQSWDKSVIAVLAAKTLETDLQI